MAEKVLEQQFCRTCGADIRRGALFCYNCGSSVAPEPVVFAKLKEDTNGSSKRNVTAVAPPIDKPIEKPSELPFEKEPEKVSAETNKLKSPAAVLPASPVAARKKIKGQDGKPVEVVWEAAGDSVNVWFVVTAVVLGLFAVGILLAMLYIQ